jgi:hypothetical protein
MIFFPLYYVHIINNLLMIANMFILAMNIVITNTFIICGPSPCLPSCVHLEVNQLAKEKVCGHRCCHDLEG